MEITISAFSVVKFIITIAVALAKNNRFVDKQAKAYSFVFREKGAFSSLIQSETARSTNFDSILFFGMSRQDCC